MRPNPSLTARLRIGFAVLFALLLAVSLLGVGRLFQIRVDYEDATSRLFQLELEAERMSSAFILEQSAVLGSNQADPEQLTQAVKEFQTSGERAADLTGGDTGLAGQLQRWVTSEGAWRQAVAEPVLEGREPPGNTEDKLTTAVTSAGENLTQGAQAAREGSRREARDDTRDTTLMVAAGLGGALIAALLLFSGLINSMRAPLARLVDGARRLAGGDLDTRVQVGGPVEIATLGKAFNEMATALERDAAERDRIEQMKDDFVLTVSHELRTPVTVVKGFAEMLTAQRKSLNTRQAEAAEVIAESANQLQGMITDLLDLARSDAGKLRIDPTPTAVKALAQRVGRQMRPHFEERDQRLTVSVEKDVPPVMADADRISQVLANLLTNANKYAQEGARVRMTASKNGTNVEFTVSDNGPGLDGEELEHVFERFWRAQSGETQAVGGTGLGLAIAKSLVELHGGTISAASKPGAGATFRFVLPIATDGKTSKRNGERARSSAGSSQRSGQDGRARSGAGARPR